MCSILIDCDTKLSKHLFGFEQLKELNKIKKAHSLIDLVIQIGSRLTQAHLDHTILMNPKC